MRESIRTLVANAMALLSDMELASVITYTNVTGTAYDTDTGSTVETKATHTGVTAVLTSFSAEEKTQDVQVITDRKALIAYNDLPIEPTENDYFVDENSVRWEVKKVLLFPGKPLHKLHVRRA